MESDISKRCLFCDMAVAEWVPFGGELSDFVRRVGINGSDQAVFGCPNCGSHDRERHLRLYLERQGLLVPNDAFRILHFAPEPILGPFIEMTIAPATYVAADLNPWLPFIQPMDIHKIPWPSNSFDMAICNHVLEHIENPWLALTELSRVLRPGGRLVCQTPYSELLEKTFEDAGIKSPEDRLYFYAQEDHVRLFGRDIERLIQSVGFVGRFVRHSEILSDIDASSYGVNAHEPFFDFRKPA